MKKVLIIGATSAIAKHCAQLWARRGNELYLVARNEKRLKAIAYDLKAKGARQTHIHHMDLNEIDNHFAMLNKAEVILGDIDTVLIAYGTLPNQKICEKNVIKTIAEIQTNALSIISLLTHIANRFEIKRSGTIAVISSVAGDRGRNSNYVYGSSKAMITSFTSGLRQRLHKANVAVVTIKPGFVNTPMTVNYKKGLLWVKPEFVSEKIVKAIDKKKDEIYIPSFWWLIMTTIKLIPENLFKRINI